MIEVKRNDASDAQRAQYAFRAQDHEGREVTLFYNNAVDIVHALMDCVDQAILLMKADLPK